MVVLSSPPELLADALTREAQCVLLALVAQLPAAQACRACRLAEDEPPQMVQPSLGRIELSSGGAIDAAVFACPRCGAVESVPLP